MAHASQKTPTWIRNVHDEVNWLLWTWKHAAALPVLEKGLPPAAPFVALYKHFPMTIKGDLSTG